VQQCDPDRPGGVPSRKAGLGVRTLAVWVGGTLPGAGNFLFVGRIPGRAALDDTFSDPAPLGHLAIIGAHPVHRNRRKAPLLTVSGEAKPSGTVLGCDRPTRAGARAPITENALLDKVHRVFDRCSPFHFATLDRGGVDHPHLPALSPGVEERAVARVFRGLSLHSVGTEGLQLFDRKT